MTEYPGKFNNAGQREQAVELLSERGMMRLHELADHGIAATTINRMLADGILLRLSRGVYQLADAPFSVNHDLAEAATRMSKGVICLVSALAYHELTDQLPRRTWIAIGAKDWQPRDHGPNLKLIRMSEHLLQADVETHHIEQVAVKMFDVPRTLVDCFRFRTSVGLSVAIEALREALRQRRTTPAEVAQYARRYRAWTVMRPYLEALASDG